MAPARESDFLRELGDFRECMELMQLQVLVAVAEQGTLRKAAMRISRTTPTVSAAVRKLEEEVGLTLFERVQGARVVLDRGWRRTGELCQTFAFASGRSSGRR
jgi:hypothetical protein